MKTKVALKHCGTYDLGELEDALTETIDLLGGSKAFFRPGENALIKPNLLTDANPELAITTHPNFVRAVVRILKRSGLEVAIADIPGEHRLESNLAKVYAVTGMSGVAEKEGVRLLAESKFIEEDGVIFSTWVREFNHIVSLPKFKTHNLTILTGAVKNVFGLTPRLYRVGLHKKFVDPNEFAKMLVGVYEKCRPTLSIIDGIVAMEGNGPAYSGVPRNMALIAASSNGLSLDSVLASIAGLAPHDIATNRYGASRHLGVTDLKEIEIAGDGLETFKVQDFKLPPAYLIAKLPKEIVKGLLGGLMEFRPKVDRSKCNGCRICIENCPLSAIKLEGKKAVIDYTKCVDCFCCLEVCPIGAMKTREGPLLHVLRFKEAIQKRGRL